MDFVCEVSVAAILSKVEAIMLFCDVRNDTKVGWCPKVDILPWCRMHPYFRLIGNLRGVS